MNKIKEIFSLDLRSLALFRILLGAVIIWDLILRAIYLRDHYTDLGVLPRGILIDKFMNTWSFSIHLMNGQTYFQAILFLITAAIAILLILGYKTKLMTILSWIFLVSLQNRNFMVLQGGDTVFRTILFWAIFLPIGARYSIDYALSSNKDENKDNNYFSMGAVALTFQLAVIYIFNALTKTHEIWTQDYTALWYALQIDQLVLPLGKVLREFPVICKILTFGTLIFELFVPMLFLAPIFKNYIRLGLVISFWLFHIGIASTLNVGLFPFICMVAWTAFLPPLFWERFTFHKNSEVQIFYDKDCGFCKKMVLFVQTFLFQEKAKVGYLQDNKDTSKILKEENSWVVKKADGTNLLRFDAIIYLLKESKIYYFVGNFFGKKLFNNIGNLTYKDIADNRIIMSKFTAPMIYREMKLKPSKFATFLVSYLLIGVALHNYSTLKSNDYKTPKFITNTNLLLRLSQNWKMFAPKPLRNDGWFNIPGKLKNGKEVSLFLGNDISWTKPADIEDMYPTQRWRKYMMNMRTKKYKKQRLYFGKWLCRIWNREHKGEEQLDSFNIYFMLEKSQLDMSKVPIKKIQVWNHNCFAK